MSRLLTIVIISCFAQSTGQAAMTVGLATPMDKVMIKGQQQGWPFEGWTSDHYDLSLARNEHEAFQVVVWSDQALSDVNVSVSPPLPVSAPGPFNGSVQVSLHQKGPWAVLRVKDTGMGIPQADISRIFTEFFRASNARRSQVPGTGVGLAGVKELVERFDGELELESEENRGSAFTVRLPLYEEEG